jgi:hypothetical protein
MFTNSQCIIVLLIILILLQCYQLFFNDSLNSTKTENFDANNYKSVNYNTPMMRCDGNTGMLNTKCSVKSNVPTIKKICSTNLKLTDGPNYNDQEKKATETPQIKNKVNEDDNSLLKLLNENESEGANNENDVKSVGHLEN